MADPEESGSESSDSESLTDEQLPMVNEVINIDFEARSPEESDADSIRRLLFQLIQDPSLDLLGLTELILSQNYVGAVVFQPDDGEAAGTSDDEEDIFGLITMINLTARKEKKPVQDLLALLKKKYDSREDSSENHDKFWPFLLENIRSVGWIINERFVNLPSQIAPNLFDSLQDDLTDAIKKSMPYQVDKYILIAKAHVLKGESLKNPIFVNDEEDLFFQNCLSSFTYLVGNVKDTATATSQWKNKKDKELTPIRVVMLLEPFVIDAQITEFRKLFTA